MARASSAYDQVVPAGMVRSAAQTRCWKGVPAGSTSIASMARRSPAKYAASASAISGGGLVSRAGEGNDIGIRSPSVSARSPRGPTANVTVPRGESTRDSSIMRGLQRDRRGRPQVHRGVGAPRSPRGGPLLEGGWQRLVGRLPQHQVSGGERVHFAERAQGQVVRRPGTDTGERAEPIDETLQRLRPLAEDLRRARDAPDALGAGAREPDLLQRRRRELLRRREQMREPIRWGGAPRAERFDQPPSERGGGADADLLPQDRADAS